MYLTNKLRLTACQLFLPCLLLSIACSSPAVAVQPDSYDVEVIIFTYRYPDSGGEQWPVRMPEQLASAGLYNSDQISELPVDAYKLNGISNGLRQSSSYSVVFHRAWRQPVYDAANAVAYPVHGVPENGRNSVDGSVRLIRERFLHLDADLFMTPAGSRSMGMEPDSLLAAPVFTLREKRRIKSNTVHYFDHPHFGMIATVIPYYSPEEAQQIAEENDNQETVEEIPVAVPAADDDQLTR